MSRITVVELQKFERLLRDRFGVRVRFKTDSKLMRLIGWLLRSSNPDFMTSYTTTVGRSVYFPSQEHYKSVPERTFVTLAHEFVHVWDYSRSRVKFILSYLFPQLLSVPVFLLSCFLMFSNVWLGAIVLLIAIVLTAPWPSPWRSHWEVRGYAMSLACWLWLHPDKDDLKIVARKITDTLCGPAYYYLSWDRDGVLRELLSNSEQITSGPGNVLPYKLVRDFLNDL